MKKVVGRNANFLLYFKKTLIFKMWVLYTISLVFVWMPLYCAFFVHIFAFKLSYTQVLWNYPKNQGAVLLSVIPNALYLTLLLLPANKVWVIFYTCLLFCSQGGCIPACNGARVWRGGGKWGSGSGVGSVAFWFGFLLWPSSVSSGVAFWSSLLLWPSGVAFCCGLLVESGLLLWLLVYPTPIPTSLTHTWLPKWVVCILLFLTNFEKLGRILYLFQNNKDRATLQHFKIIDS